MSGIEDGTHLSDVMMPGTHNSCVGEHLPWLTPLNSPRCLRLALYWWPFAQCQSRSKNLLVQLEDGIRVFDVRLGIVDNALVSYHDFVPQETTFLDIVATLKTFLRSEAGKNECVVMSIKQEDFAKHSPELFSKLVHDQVIASEGDNNFGDPSPSASRDVDRAVIVTKSPAPHSGDLWYLQNRVPRLGEVRGKIILFSRFGGDGAGWEGGLDGVGIHPTRWPDSPNYVWNWECGDTTFQQEDWYARNTVSMLGTHGVLL